MTNILSFWDVVLQPRSSESPDQPTPAFLFLYLSTCLSFNHSLLHQVRSTSGTILTLAILTWSPFWESKFLLLKLLYQCCFVTAALSSQYTLPVTPYLQGHRFFLAEMKTLPPGSFLHFPEHRTRRNTRPPGNCFFSSMEIFIQNRTKNWDLSPFASSSIIQDEFIYGAQNSTFLWRGQKSPEEVPDPMPILPSIVGTSGYLGKELLPDSSGPRVLLESMEIEELGRWLTRKYMPYKSEDQNLDS